MEHIGEKHPGALGITYEEALPEAMDPWVPLLRNVVSTGASFVVKDSPFVLLRRGFFEEIFANVTASRVFDAEG